MSSASDKNLRFLDIPRHDPEKLPVAEEIDEPGYRLGQQLVKRGRDAEALSAFIKVIEKRGEQASAESHLEAGLIYLRHFKDPVEAIHHFQRYLALQPKAKLAPKVRGLVDTARREFARTLPAHPLESQAIGLDQLEQNRLLQREVEELKAENTALRALSPAPRTRVSRATIDAGDITLPPASATPPPAVSLTPNRPAAPVGDGFSIVSAPPKPALFTPGPVSRSNPTSATGGRKYTIARGDSLYALSKKFGVTVEEIAAANRDTIPNVNTPLRTGAEIRIP